MTGEMIAAARTALGLTQAALARSLDMKTPQLCKIERGVSEPRQETLERIAAALGLTVDRKLRTRLRDDLRVYYKKHPAAKEPKSPRALRDPNLRWEVMG